MSTLPEPGQQSKRDNNERIANARRQASEQARRAVANGPGASFHDGLWDGRHRLGIRVDDDPMAHDKNSQVKISSELFGKARTPKQKAQYLADLIGGLSDGKVPPDAPPSCSNLPVVEKLDPPQIVPKMLITPTSPIQRLVVVQPPGAGKTCIMLDIMSNFLTEDYNIIIVGDPDVFSAVKSNLRKCPAHAPGGLLRERNTHLADPWCALYSNAKKDFIAPAERPVNCERGEKFGKARIYWLTYVLFGNWLARKHQKYTKDDRDDIFGSNTLVLMDEVHKLTAPTEERASPSWRKSLLYVGGQLSSKEPAPGKKLFVVGFTATPIIDDPVQAICLATVMKGRTDPSIFTDEGMTQLRVDPKKFYTSKFVEPVEDIAVREPGVSTSARLVPIDDVTDLLRKNDCLQTTTTTGRSTKKAAAQTGDDNHPCPVSAADRSKNLLSVFSLKESAALDLERLFSNLFFVTNNTADSRKYPKLIQISRLVDYDSYTFASAARAALKAQAGKLSWQEVSNFADASKLRDYVKRRLNGHPHTPEDTDIIEKNAPKWHSLYYDLHTRRDLAGKTAVYLGARTVPGVATSTDYLFGLSFYLQAKLGVKDGNATLQGRGRPASVYMMPDETDENNLKKAKERIKEDPYNRLALAGSPEMRNRHLEAFNSSPCVGQVLGGSHAEHYSILLLGYEAYKALDLTCTSNLARMVLQPSGKAEQTIGRARRSCAFAKVPKERWTVNALTYVFQDNRCPDGNCDCVLGSFFEAQARLQGQVLRILRGASIGCSNFKTYNQWPAGTVCLLDKDAPLQRTPDQQTRPFFFCSYSGAWGYDPTGELTPEEYEDMLRKKAKAQAEEQKNDSADEEEAVDWGRAARVAFECDKSHETFRRAPIRPGVSGDVSPKLVLESCAGRCTDDETRTQVLPMPRRCRRRLPRSPSVEVHARPGRHHRLGAEVTAVAPSPQRSPSRRTSPRPRSSAGEHSITRPRSSAGEHSITRPHSAEVPLTRLLLPKHHGKKTPREIFKNWGPSSANQQRS